METYERDNQNLFKSIKTACNKRVASKIEVADWQLKVMVLRTEPIWSAFDRSVQTMQTIIIDSAKNRA